MTAQMWRRLDVDGRDAARVSPLDGGWLIAGHAVFRGERDGPTGLRYRVGIDADWRSLWGEIEGFAGDRVIRHRIARDGAGWTLDGVRAEGLDDLVDLDFGFTPATNYQQVRRIALAQGEEAAFDVGWFDVENGGSGGLLRLAQMYRRTGERTYAYASPQGGYRETLTMGESGFCIDYPGLWVGVS